MRILGLSLALLVFANNAHAATPFDYDLAQKAMTIAGQADAYNEYCKKPSNFGEDFVARFRKGKLEEDKIKALQDSQQKSFNTTMETLNTEKKDCKDVNLLLKRLEIMRGLKDISYEMNGIGPATVKDNIPPLEMLAPNDMRILPYDVPPEPEPEIVPDPEGKQ